MSGLEILAGLAATKGVDFTIRFLDEKRILKRAINKTTSHYKGIIPSLEKYLDNWTKSKGFKMMLRSLKKGESYKEVVKDGIDSILTNTALQKREDAEKILEYCFQSILDELYKSREGLAISMHRQEQMQVELKDFLKGELDEIKSPSVKPSEEQLDEFEIKKYEYPQKHIKRTISHLSSIQHKSESFYTKIEKEKLDKVITNKKRIILLGDGGSGKSNELEYLAAKLSHTKANLIPVFKSFNFYTPDQGIENYLPQYWNKIPDSKLLLILDGLDEIPPNDFNKVVRQLNSFSQKNDEIRIVVSSRTNFYELPTNNSQGTLPGYEPYFLNDFTIDDVKKFYKANFEEEEVNDFVNKIFENNLSDLIANPFFVIVLAEVYSKNKTLSIDRSDLVEEFLYQRMEFDEEHFRATFGIRPKKQEIIELMEKIALGMEILARNYIQETHLLKLVSSDEFELLQYSPTFAKKKGSDKVWEFEHNNIQEYLAARILSKQEYDKIKKFITFEPDHKKLNPSWLNTLSFLFSLLKHSNELFEQLLEWLLKNEQEVIVKFERDKISSAIRNKLFKEIFNHYKAHDVWINSNKFSDRELVQFGQSEENLNFLIEEIEDVTNSRTIKLNAINLIGHFDYEVLGTNPKRKVQKLLLAEANTNTEDHYYVNSVIHALNHAKMYDKEVVEKIMSQFQDRDNEYIRSSIYSLLLDSNLLEEYVDYLIQGQKLLNSSELDKNSEDRGSSSLIDENWYLKDCFKNITSPKGLALLYKNISKERYLTFGFDSEEVVKAIIDNSIKAYKIEKSIYNNFLHWFLEQVNNFRWQWINDQLRFFEETETKEKAFYDIWNEEDKTDQETVTALAYLATKRSLEFVLEKYDNNDCTDKDIKELYLRMNRIGNESQSFFKKLIDRNTSIQIEEPEPRIDYQKLREDKKQRDFDLLFKENGLKNNIAKIFYKEGKNEFTEDDLFQMRKTEHGMVELGDIYPHPSLKLLRNFAHKDKAVEKDSILQWFKETPNVVWYKISMIYEYLSRNEGIKVNNKQCAWIKKWCEENINDIDFKEAIDEKQDGGFSIAPKAVYLWYFLRRFDFEYQKETMLDMLSFDYMDNHSWVGIKYLENKLDKQTLENRIVQNLKGGVQVEQVLLNHIQYAVKHRINEVYPIIIEEILNNNREDHNRVKILNIYADEIDNVNSLHKLLPDADSYIRWKIVEKIYEYECFGYLEEYLESILTGNYEGHEKLNASEYLVKMENLKGLEYYVGFLKDEKPINYDYAKTNCLNNLIKIKVLPYLVELLELSYEIDKKLDRMNSLKNNTLSAIKRIGLENKDNFHRVRSSLQSFMEEHRDTKNVKYLLHTIERLEQQFYMNKAQSYSIDQVKEKLKLVG